MAWGAFMIGLRKLHVSVPRYMAHELFNRRKFFLSNLSATTEQHW